MSGHARSGEHHHRHRCRRRSRETRHDTLAGYGSVGYNYNIGKYEVTAGQYTAFLNAVASHRHLRAVQHGHVGATTYGCKISGAALPAATPTAWQSDCANRPVNYVSYWDSCRFANWLGNGQGTGDHQRPAHTLWTATTALMADTIQRNAGCDVGSDQRG